MVLTSFFSSFDDNDACTNGHQFLEGGMSYLAQNKLGSIVQSIHNIVQDYFSLFIAN